MPNRDEAKNALDAVIRKFEYTYTSRYRLQKFCTETE